MPRSAAKPAQDSSPEIAGLPKETPKEKRPAALRPWKKPADSSFPAYQKSVSVAPRPAGYQNVREREPPYPRQKRKRDGRPSLLGQISLPAIGCGSALWLRLRLRLRLRVGLRGLLLLQPLGPAFAHFRAKLLSLLRRQHLRGLLARLATEFVHFRLFLFGSQRSV